MLKLESSRLTVLSILLLALAGTSCIKKQGSKIKDNGKEDLTVYVGPQDGQQGNIFLVAAPSNVDRVSLCQMDPKTKDCEPTAISAMNLAGTTTIGRKVFSSRSGMANELNMAYIASSFDSNNKEVFKRIFSLDKPSANGAAWKIVLVSGDHLDPDGATPAKAWDNARKKVKELLIAKGAKAENFRELSNDPKEQVNGILDSSEVNVKKAFSDLKIAPNENCLVFMTSHGSQNGFYIRDRGEIVPDAFNSILETACGSRPTVALVSACYSGVMINPTTQKSNRIILTAARKDRTSFGCDSSQEYTYWDKCLVDSLPAAKTWKDLFNNVNDCVTKAESGITDPHSEPQSFFGADTANLEILGAASSSSIPSQNPSTNTSKPALQLGAKDLQLTNSSGATTSMAKIFGDADYVMVDLSQSGCGYCVELAGLVEQSKNYFSSKCKSLTIAPNVQSWIDFAQSQGADVASHSFSTPGGPEAAAAKLGVEFTGTPTVITIDRLGAIKSSHAGAFIPDFIQQNCN